MTNALALVIVLVLCAALVGVALVMAANIRPGRPLRRRPHRDSFRRMRAQPRQRRFAVIVNPTKFTDLQPVIGQLNAVARELNWAPPLVFETTREDTGTGQTRLALAEGVDLVASLGGDGTVRAVATALVGTDTPLGLLPAGTGNLLARNLDLALDDLTSALRLALQGRNRAIDVGWVDLSPPPAEPGESTASGSATADDLSKLEHAEATGGAQAQADAAIRSAEGPEAPAVFGSTPATNESTDTMGGARAGSAGSADSATTGGAPVVVETAPGELGSTAAPPAAGHRHAFLVMAGIGLDATIMAETTEEAKAKMGWPAYVATGLRNMLGPRFKVEVTVDGGQPVRAYARTVLVGNCGRITGGINLMPDAQPDDGVLDCVLLSPKGLAGWVLITARVLTLDRKERHERMARHTGLRFEIATDNPKEVQLDGDVIGEAARVTVEIAPKALLVRVGATVDVHSRTDEGGAPVA